jgi:hypothetical protein
LIARKPLDLPPAVARAFVDDMRAYFAEENPIKREGIAVRQLRAQRAPGTAREKATPFRREGNVRADEGSLHRPQPSQPLIQPPREE